VVSVRALVAHQGAASDVAQLLRRAGRNSFGWRLAQDERHIGVALKKPILGFGEWNWWMGSATRPWSLWLLVFGMYGFVGLIAVQCLQLIPVARVVWYPATRSETDDFNLQSVLAAVILMSAIDNLLNGSMILPLVLLIGGLNGGLQRRSVLQFAMAHLSAG
jgi:hypothetical protein